MKIKQRTIVGAEDDDMEARLSITQVGFERPNIQIAHYKMLKHSSGQRNPKRRQLLKKARTRYSKDGLNNVKYTLKRIVQHRMFTHLLIDVGNPPDEFMKKLTTKKEKHLNVTKSGSK